MKSMTKMISFVRSLCVTAIVSLLAQSVWAAIPTPVAHWTNLSEGATGDDAGKFTVKAGTGCTFTGGKAVVAKSDTTANTGLLVEWEDGQMPSGSLTIVVKYSGYDASGLGNNSLVATQWGDSYEIVAYANGGGNNVGLSANVTTSAGGTQNMASPTFKPPTAGYMMVTLSSDGNYGTSLSFKASDRTLYQQATYQSGHRYGNTAFKKIKIGGTWTEIGKYHRPGLTIEEVTIYKAKVTAADMNADIIANFPEVSFTKANDTDWASKTMPTKANTAAVTANTSFAGNGDYIQPLTGGDATVVNVTDVASGKYVFGLHAFDGENGLGAITRDIYLMVSGGTPAVINGGEDAKWDSGSKTIPTGNVLVNVKGDTTADYVYGAGLGGGTGPNGNPLLAKINGNVGIVVEGNAQVKGSIIAGWQSRHNTIPEVTGNTSILIKNVQTHYQDATLNTENQKCEQGWIAAGGIHKTNGGRSKVGGNASVTVLLDEGATGTFNKNIVAGGIGIGGGDGQNVAGNGTVSITAPNAVTFAKNIVGGGHSTGNNARIGGNTSVTINGGTYTGQIYAGGDHNAATVAGTATLTINGGVFTSATLNGGTATGAKKLVFNCSREFAWANITGFNEIAIADAQQFTMSVANSNVRELSAALTGAGSFAKTGTGTLTLSGTNTYTGNTTISGGTIKATTKNSLGTGTVTAQSGTTLFVPATDETPYTIGGGAVKVRVSAEQQAGEFPLVTGIKVADGAELTLSVVDASDAELTTLEATVENGVIKIDTKVEFKDVLWNRENSRWEDSNGIEVTMDKTCNIALIDGDSVTFTASPNKVVLPASGTVTINNHQNLGSMLINVPESTTLVLPTSGYSENIKFSGTGTIQIGGTNTATKHNLYNGWLRNSNLESFTGTIHMIAGRFETQTEAIRSDITIKVTNGSQLSTGSTGTWNNHFILSGNGWTGESGAFNTVPLRLGCTLGESAIVDMVREETDTVEPGISVHSQDLTIGATITGTCGMRLIGGTAQTLTFSKPQNCTLTGTVTVNNLNLRFSKTDGTAIGMSAGQAIHFGDTIKLSAGKYLKLHPWTGSACDNSTSNKVTIESSIELADGSYITVDDGSYVFSGNVSVVENATAKFTPNWRKGWIFSNLNVPASATFSVEQDQHNDSNSSVLAITGGTVAGTLNLKGTAADRPVLTSLTSSVVTGAKAVNLKGAVSLDLGNVTSAMTSHFVSQEGVNSLTVTCEYSNGSGSISTTDTKDSPLIKIESGSTLNLAYNNFSGWAGDLTNGYIVNEGTLNIANKDDNSAFFRNHLILADGAVTTLNNTYSSVILYGGVGTEATAQIQLPSGTAEIAGGENSLGFALGNNKNDGGYGGKGAGITVGDDAALTISAKVVNKWNNAKGDNLVKYGNGALILSNSENTYTGDVTLKAGTIQSAKALTVTTDVSGMMVVGNGSEATPYALAAVVAKIGDTPYASVQDAIAHLGEGETITLVDTTAELPADWTTVTKDGVVTIRQKGDIYYVSGYMGTPADPKDAAKFVAANGGTTALIDGDTIVINSTATGNEVWVASDFAGKKFSIAKNFAIHAGANQTSLLNDAVIDVVDDVTLTISQTSTQKVALGSVTINGAVSVTTDITATEINGTCTITLADGKSITIDTKGANVNVVPASVSHKIVVDGTKYTSSLKTFTITITPVAHTTVTVDGAASTASSITVDYGTNHTIVYTADMNYKLNGEGSFTLENVTADTTVGNTLSVALIETEIAPSTTELQVVVPQGADSVEVVDAEGEAVAENKIPLTTGLYTVKAKKDGDVVATETLGVIAAKDAEEGETPTKVTTAVAVPFTGATVANLLNTALLTKDDMLMAYLDGSYKSWKLTAEKTWTPVTTAKSGEQIDAPQAENAALQRGSAVWVTTAGKVVVLGKYDEDTAIVEPTTKETHLLANPTMSDYTPEVKEDETDELIEIGVAKPVRYTKCNGEWTKPGLIEEDGEFFKGPVPGAPVIPVGKGFWFIKK